MTKHSNARYSTPSLRLDMLAPATNTSATEKSANSLALIARFRSRSKQHRVTTQRMHTCVGTEYLALLADQALAQKIIASAH